MSSADPTHPTIPAWLPRLWRTRDSVQIGLEPGIGAIVEGLDATTASWLAGIDGTRNAQELIGDARDRGIDPDTATALLADLVEFGAAQDGAVPTELTDGGRLLPELVALSRGTPGGPAVAAEVLQRRRTSRVVVLGAGRVGVPLAGLLAASGIGSVQVQDSSPSRRCDAAVGGLTLGDEGRPRSLAAAQALRRVAALTGAAQSATDLLVLCHPHAAHDPLARGSSEESVAHLPVAVREGRVVVGPLVLPGRTSCLHCAELHRTDRDPSWPVVAAQLVAGPHGAGEEPNSVTAALAAAVGAAQALDHLDGIRAVGVIESTLELQPPDWQPLRRAWPTHPDCGCTGDLSTFRASTG